MPEKDQAIQFNPPSVQLDVDFTGELMIGKDPVAIGQNNYSTLSNLRYVPEGLEMVLGHVAVNSSNLDIYEQISGTEYDSADRLDVDTSGNGCRLSVESLDNDENVYWISSSSCGFSQASGGAGTGRVSFEFLLTSQSATGKLYIFTVLGLGLLSPKTINNLGALTVYIENKILYIDDFDGGVTVVSGGAITVDTTYYIDFYRSGGSLYCYVYTDKEKTVLFGSSNFVCTNAVLNEMILMSGELTGGGGTSVSATLSNLILDGFSDAVRGYSFRTATNYAKSIYTLAQVENGSLRAILQNSTEFKDNGNGTFATGTWDEVTPLHFDATGANYGSFSEAPRGHITYCNGSESMIWAGEEMPCAAVLQCNITTSPAESMTFTAAAVNTIAATTNLAAAGWLPGWKFLCSAAGAANDGLVYTIKSIATTTITTVEDIGSTETDTFTLSVLPAFGGIADILDRTVAANNEQTDSNNIISLGGDNLSDTVVYLQFSGSEGSTTITNTGAATTKPTVTAVGNAHITTVAGKNNSSCLTLDGTGDYLTIDEDFAGSKFFYTATDPFTWDMWVFPTEISSSPASYVLLSQYEDADNYLEFKYYNYGSEGIFALYCVVRTGGVGFSVSLGSLLNNFLVGQWNHIVLQRGMGGDADNISVACNGVSHTVTGPSNWSMPDMSGVMNVGAKYDGSDEVFGYIAEVRFTDGRTVWPTVITPPETAHSINIKDLLIFSTRPLKGMNFDVLSANQTAAMTSTLKTFTGTGFAQIAISDGTKSSTAFDQSGKITFADTQSISKPFNYDGLSLYAYLLEAQDGTICQISNITLDAPFQGIKDIWDGVYRQPITFQRLSSAGYEDWTIEVNYNSNKSDAIGAQIGDLLTTEHIICAFEDRISALLFNMVPTKENSTATILSIECWNGTDYETVSGLYDETATDTAAYTSLNGSGQVRWSTPPIGAEEEKTDFGVTGYFYRLTVSVALGGAVDAVIVNTVTGIPAQIEVKPFRRCGMFKDIALLMNYEKGGEGGRVDFGLRNAPDVWNGTETSKNGQQSLYFGGSEGINAGVQIYNRFGSNIYSMYMVFKDREIYVLTGNNPSDFQIYTVARRIGCPAPETIAVGEVGFAVEGGDITRSVIFFLSHLGPMVFDGATVSPLRGLEELFAPSDSQLAGERIQHSKIANCTGYWDAYNNEYNLRLVISSAVTYPDRWFVYSVRERKWFEKNEGTKSGNLPHQFQVTDQYGREYNMVTAGPDIRVCDFGQDWDGSNMVFNATTGYGLPADKWNKTRLRYGKILHTPVDAGGSVVTVTGTAVDGDNFSFTSAIGGTVLQKTTKPLNALAYMWKVAITGTPTASTTGFRLFSLSLKGTVEREDLST